MHKLIISGLVFLFFASVNIASEIKFVDATPEEAGKLAAREGKLVFIEFVAGWSQPCNKMNQTTHKNNSVAAIANANYISIKVDVDGFEGFRYKKQYNIKLLPTIIIFSSNGKQLYRNEGFMDSNELYGILKRYNLPQYKAKTANKEMVTQKGATPASYEQTSQRLISSRNPKYDGIYRWDVAKVPSTGYGIQVGAFNTYESVLAETARIKKQHTIPILVSVGEKNNQTIYRILLGPFNAKGEAQSYLNRMKKKGQAGFVKNLSSL